MKTTKPGIIFEYGNPKPVEVTDILLWNVGNDFFAALANKSEKASVVAETILYTLLTLDLIDCDAYSFWARS